MKKSVAYKISFFTLLAWAIVFHCSEITAQNLRNKKWQKEGVFSGRSPEQELTNKRTQISKTFRNGDGTNTIYFTGLTHYKDENGNWQDVDYTVLPNHSGKNTLQTFCNTTQEIKSYFPNSPGSSGIKMTYNNQELSFWQNPKMKFTVSNGNTLLAVNPLWVTAVTDNNKLTYTNIYEGMDEEVIVLEDGQGLEDNILINKLSADFINANAASNVEFYQFIPFAANYKVYDGDKEIKTDDVLESFLIKDPMEEKGFVFNPVVIFDNAIKNKQEAMELLQSPAERLTSEQAEKLKHSIVKGSYKIKFVQGGIEVSTVVPYQWFTQSNRAFPVTVDPSITVGSNNSATFYILWNGYHPDTRIQSLYLSSDLTGAGLSNGDIITAIGLIPTSVDCNGNETGLKIRMQNTASTTFGSTSFTNTGYTNNYSGSQNITGVSWYTHTFSTNYTFNSSQNLIIDFTKDATTYNCVSDRNYWAIWTPGSNRSIYYYNVSDIGDPQSLTTGTRDSRVPYLTITYNSATPPGNAYGIYGASAQSSYTVTDCYIAAAGGSGGGSSCLVCLPTTTGYSSVNIANTTSYPVIVSGDAINNYKNCTNSNINMTAAGSPTWTFNGSGADGTGSGSGSPKTTSYPTTGRKTVTMNNGSSHVYKDFNNIITAAPSAGSIGASASGVCPSSTAVFTSSLGSAVGYSFAWSLASTPAGIAIASQSGQATPTYSISFTNSNASATTVTVQLIVTSQCCGALTAITKDVSVYPNPAAPTSAAPGVICPGSNATLTATAPAGASFNWYNASTAGTLLGSGATYVPSAPATTTTYYVEATNASGCVSTARTPVIITVTPTSAPTVPGITICSPDFVTLTVSSPVAGATYNFYSGNCTGLIQSGFAYSYTTPNMVSANTTYYVSVTTPGCNESSCTAVATTVTATPTSVTWIGGTAGANNWFVPANWGGCLPSCNTDVNIPNVGNPPDIGFSSTYGNAACKSITINSSVVLSFSDSKAELDVCGDFTNAGTITTNSLGKIKFSGSAAQNYIQTGTGDLYNVVLANTAALPTLTIKDGVGYSDMTISASGQFAFQSGVLIVEGGRKLVIKNTANSALSGQSVSSYVNGRLNRYVVAGTSYDFPVGGIPVSGNSYPYELMNINFTSVSGGLTNLTVSFENPVPTFAIADGTGLPINETSSFAQYTTLIDNGGNNTGTGNPGNVGGLWTMLPNAGTATYDMTLYGRNYSNAGVYEHSIVKRNTFCPGAWTISGAYTSSSVSGNVVTATRSGMTGFSQVGLAKPNIPLPIKLVMFDATCHLNNTILSWITASESNNNYFTIERSCDENFFNYQMVATIAGAGNSNALRKYTYTDNDLTAGQCYYRLSQTDYNGTTNEFTPVAINCNENSNFNFIGIVPNPATDETNVLFTINNTDVVYMELTNTMGQQVIQKNILAEIGLNKININLTNVNPGVYFVKIDNGKKSFIKKLVKK